MKNIFIIILFLVFIISCDSIEKNEPIVIDYKLVFTQTDDYIPAIGIPNPFYIECDSSFYTKVFLKGNELETKGSGCFLFKPKEEESELRICFYKVKEDSLVYCDTIKVKANRLPNPYLRFLYCDSLCNSLKNIKNVSKLRCQLYYYGIDIQIGINQYQISIIRDSKVIDSKHIEKVDFENYRSDKKVNSIIENLKVGDVLKFDSLYCKMPDGTTRNLEEKEILIIN